MNSPGACPSSNATTLDPCRFADLWTCHASTIVAQMQSEDAATPIDAKVTLTDATTMTSSVQYSILCLPDAEDHANSRVHSLHRTYL